MNKTELRQSYINAGWEVQPVSEWKKVSGIQGKVKYDVDVVSPENSFGTAQVVVADDSGTTEEAIAEGFWKESSATFDYEVRSFVTEIEGGDVFAVAITQIYPSYEIAEAKAYMTNGSVDNYVVKRRNGEFSFIQLV